MTQDAKTDQEMQKPGAHVDESRTTSQARNTIGDRDTTLTNRRDHSRRTAIKGAKIVFNGRQSTLDCRVRDLSGSGARLEFSSQQLLPHSFELHIPDNSVRICELRWAKGNQAGVRFLLVGQ